MKIYGYSDQGLPIEDIVPVELAEITLNATPDETRKIAAFLLSAADSMERMGDSYSHVHLADVQPEFEGSPHFTVFNSELSGGR
ncbi:Imm32 family immunity protein [Pseudoxanthomonas sacheonensis]|uniref:Uncharacterized protein n=1 Tax=Pseudoxanthomonas sacheonensis TaxID=443615 RepID=A0ABU1RSJ7_9GAMM|nr:hypothetical protein [Pseudoxanthomonas sacheonensis]MDR6841756.1 hypothetical protein [Pseudoxanthomonas sacheonensis]